MTARNAGDSLPGYLTIRHLVHRYPGSESAALDDISLNIAKGCTFGLLGPNGAGKSTLLSLLTGIIAPQAGEISIGPHRLPGDITQIKAMSALVPQEYAFYPSLTARENLKFFAGLYRLSSQTWRDRLAECVEICRLQEVLDKRSEHFSGGIKRRLNLAIGLLANPQILYLDEPTVGIDAVSRGFILEAIAKLKGRGTTIIYTSHYMEEVEALCDEIAVIDHGKVIAHAQVAQLLSKQASQLLRITLREPLTQIARDALAHWSVEYSDDRHLTLTTALSDLDGILRLLSKHGAQVEQLQYGVSRLHDVYLKLLEDRT
jgi:ABC-2 type transport system ATP-binding protein